MYEGLEVRAARLHEECSEWRAKGHRVKDMSDEFAAHEEVGLEVGLDVLIEHIWREERVLRHLMSEHRAKVRVLGKISGNAVSREDVEFRLPRVGQKSPPQLATGTA